MALTHCMLHVEGLDVVMCAKHPSQKKGSPFKNRNSSHWTILRLVLTAFHMINCLHSYCCADETRARVHFLLFCDVQLRAPWPIHTGCHIGFAVTSLLWQGTLPTRHPLHGARTMALAWWLSQGCPKLFPFVQPSYTHIYIYMIECMLLCYQNIISIYQHTERYVISDIWSSSLMNCRRPSWWPCLYLILSSLDTLTDMWAWTSDGFPAANRFLQFLHVRSAMLMPHGTLTLFSARHRVSMAWPLGEVEPFAGLLGHRHAISMPFWELASVLLLQTLRRHTGRWHWNGTRTRDFTAH